MKYQELHQLIHSLSRAEKRYFKMQAQTRPGPKEKSYLLLFDLFNAQKELDLAAIESKFMASGYGKHFSWARSHLFQLVLKSMRSFHAGKDYRQQLSALLQDIRFLFNRRLYHKCDALIRKGLQLARKYDDPLWELRLLEFARGRLLNGLKKGYSAEVEPVLRQEAQAASSYQLRLELARVYSQLVDLSRQSLRPATAKLRAQFEATVNQQWDMAQSHPSFFIRHFGTLNKATFQVLLGDYETFFVQFNRLYQLWKAVPHLISAHHSIYQKILNNVLTACQLTERYHLYPEFLPQLDPKQAETLDEEGEVFQNSVHHHLIYSLNTGHLEGAVALVPEIEEGFEKYGSKINPARQLSLNLNLCIAFFLLERFGDAAHWNRQILEWERSEVRQDLRQFALLMRLLLVFETGDYPYLENLVHSTREYFRRRDQPFHFERFLIRGVHRLALAPDEEARKLVFKTNRAELKALAEEQPEIKGAIGYEELGYWLESHVSGRRMQEIMNEKLGEDSLSS